MNAVRIVKPGQLEVFQMPMPELQDPGDVLLRMTAGGVCGSDVGIYHGTNAAATYPRIIGHEMVGVVEQVGSAVDAVSVGDRVIVDQVVACGHCYACRHDRPNVCGSLQVRGVHIDGGYREYMVVPSADCHLLPDDLSDTDAVMIEPTTIALQSVSRGEVTEDDDLLILGYGALGSSIMRVAQLLHPHVIIVADVDPAKLEDARAAGADHVIDGRSEDVATRVRELTEGYGATVSIDAACVGESLMTAMEATGNAGRVVNMGLSVTPIEINRFAITSKELDVRGSRLQRHKFPEAIELARTHRVDLRGSVSHTFPLVEAQRAFGLIDSRDPSIRKVALTIGE